MKAEKTEATGIEITPSSGNVFADLGLPDAETLLLKANLAVDIEAIVQRRRLTRAKAAKMLGLSQSELADILGGRLRDYPVECLLRLLTALGRDVAIVIRKPKSRRQGRLTLEAA